MMNRDQQQPMNTGDISTAAGQATSREYTAETQEIDFSPEQHDIWKDLYAGVHRPYLLEHLSRAYIQGMDLLKLDPDHIPTVAYLNERIEPRTGWRIERTVVRYTLADDWYKKFAKHIFLITDYLR